MHLDDDDIYQKQLVSHQNKSFLSNQNVNNQEGKEKKDLQRQSKMVPNHVKPIVYNIVGGQNSVIRIGPQGIQVQSNQPNFPPVPVQCGQCKTKQLIPGNVDKYFCCNCKKQNGTQPKFGLFICYVCRQYVCYPYFTSEHIHCNYCTSINLVQKNPNKKTQRKKQPTQKFRQQKEIRELDEIQVDQNGDMITIGKQDQENISQF